MIQPNHTNRLPTRDEQGPCPVRLSLVRLMALAVLGLTLVSSLGCSLLKDEDDLRMDRMLFESGPSDSVKARRVHGGITP